MEPLAAAIARDGYAFVHAREMRELLTSAGSLGDWTAFAASWNHLELDHYMADGGRYRRRRHANYTATVDGGIVRAAASTALSEPRLQRVERRHRAMVRADRARGRRRREHARDSRPARGSLFERLGGRGDWHVEVHQFRIEARRDERGQPTPEGIHRDGVDYVLVLLIDRQNIASGTTTVHALTGDELGAFTLAAPLDAALLDDARVAHGVTAIEPVDGDQPAWRDVLVVTWRRRRPDAIESP